MVDRSVGSRAVLGIDAAWTEREPSGVAVAVETASGWKLAAVDASYDQFIGRGNGVQVSGERPMGSKPKAGLLIDAARRLCGQQVDLVAVDMPMSRLAITGRRTCDEVISKKFGAMGAATHSPSTKRPGIISDALRGEFETLCFALCTAAPANGLIEVYPHPALIEFLKAPYRLQCKAAKAGRYWPGLPIAERRQNLREVWSQIVEALEQRIEGVRAALPAPLTNERGWRIKAYEDKLDAVVCAAVAIAALKGEASAYGDGDAAIWVPTSAPKDG